MKSIIFTLIGFIVFCSCKKDSNNLLTDSTTVIIKKQDSLLLKSIDRGALIYEGFCMTCHLPDGTGVEGIYPPLAQSDYLKNYRIESIKAVKYGMSGDVSVNGITYNNIMASQGLNDKEIADVMNYISYSWGNNLIKEFTEEEVSKIKP
jgi:mono/diheme cytochrome c family protein